MRRFLMAVKKGTSNKTARAPQVDKGEKTYKAALAAFEQAVMARLSTARDPFSAGIRMATQIRELAEKVEGEVGAEAASMTEVGYSPPGIVGVGV
jgi:hypothetical protein